MITGHLFNYTKILNNLSYKDLFDLYDIISITDKSELIEIIELELDSRNDRSYIPDLWGDYNG